MFYQSWFMTRRSREGTFSTRTFLISYVVLKTDTFYCLISSRLRLDSFFFLDDWGCMLNTYLVEKSNLIFFLTQMTGETRDNNTNQSSWADKQFIFELCIKTRPPIMIFQTKVFLTSSSKNQFSPPGEINILFVFENSPRESCRCHLMEVFQWKYLDGIVVKEWYLSR